MAMTGVIGAIAGPETSNAVDRGKQKRTMAAMRSIGAAIESYAVDNNVYPITSSVESLRPLLEPRYIKAMPMSDGWGQSFQIDASTSSYTLFSFGKDGAGVTCTAGTTTHFFNEICFVNGAFTRYPSGPQQ